MATQEATLSEQVFFSAATNLSVTRFPALTDIQNGLQRKLSPGLRYEFGRSSGVMDSHGFDIPVGGAVRVTDDLRKRDRQYVLDFGHLYPPERDVEPQPNDQLRGPHQADRFLSTEEFLRLRCGQTGDFKELPPVAPASAGDLRRITDLVIDGDVPGLLALYEAEEAGWARPDVLEAAQSALSKIAERQEAQPPAA